jgi:DNA-binding NtrC family response regulator
MDRVDVTGIAPSAMELLERYDWPGNVRQLQSAIRQALINTTGMVVGTANLPKFVREANQTMDDLRRTSDLLRTEPDAEWTQAKAPASDACEVHVLEKEPEMQELLPQSVDDSFDLTGYVQDRLAKGSTDLYNEVHQQIERRMIAMVLKATEGNQSKTADILGISRGKLRDRIATYGIQMDRTISFEE